MHFAPDGDIVSAMLRSAFAVGNIVLLGTQGCAGGAPSREPPAVVTPPAQPAGPTGAATRGASGSIPASGQPFHCYAAEYDGEKISGCEPTHDQCMASLAGSTRQGATVVEACNGVGQAYCLHFKGGPNGASWNCQETKDGCAAATAWVNTVFKPEITSPCAAHATHPEAPPAKR